MIHRTGKYYSGRIGGDEIQGELIWFGKTPAIRGWWRQLIKFSSFEEAMRWNCGSLGTYAFGVYEVDEESLRLLTAEEVEQMKLDDEKSLALALKR
ncbi:MAG: hypothetical protein II968_01100 [Selenomonadaceae bacterium]|nr:hypothetical protein [Selenomonadaceae bacterium]